MTDKLNSAKAFGAAISKKANLGNRLFNKLTGRGKELARGTNDLETPYGDKEFVRELSLTARSLLSAGIISAAVGIAVYAVGDKTVDAPEPTRHEIMQTVDVNRIATIDLVNSRERLLPYGENSVPPIDYVLSKTAPQDKERAAAHIETLQEILSVIKGFDYYIEQNEVDTTDPIAIVVAASEYDERNRSLLTGGRFKGDYSAEQANELFSRLEQIGENEIVDRETIDYHESYDKEFPPMP